MQDGIAGSLNIEPSFDDGGHNHVGVLDDDAAAARDKLWELFQEYEYWEGR